MQIKQNQLSGVGFFYCGSEVVGDLIFPSQNINIVLYDFERLTKKEFYVSILDQR